MRGAAAKWILGCGAGLAVCLFALAVLAEFDDWLSHHAREAELEVRVMGVPIARRYMERAVRAFPKKLPAIPGGIAPREASGSTSIHLIYLSDSDSAGPMQWSGIDADYVQRDRMNWACNPPYDGYEVFIVGQKEPGSVKASIRGREVPISATGDMPRFYENDDVLERYDPVKDGNIQQAGIAPESNDRVFVAPAGSKATSVALTNLPLYEVDWYSAGRWIWSFGVWSSKADRDSAKVTTYP